MDAEEALRGLERGGLFFGFVFLWDIFFVQRVFWRRISVTISSPTSEKSFFCGQLQSRGKNLTLHLYGRKIFADPIAIRSGRVFTLRKWRRDEQEYQIAIDRLV